MLFSYQNGVEAMPVLNEHKKWHRLGVVMQIFFIILMGKFMIIFT